MHVFCRFEDFCFGSPAFQKEQELLYVWVAQILVFLSEFVLLFLVQFREGRSVCDWFPVFLFFLWSLLFLFLLFFGFFLRFFIGVFFCLFLIFLLLLLLWSLLSLISPESLSPSSPARWFPSSFSSSFFPNVPSGSISR